MVTAPGPSVFELSVSGSPLAWSEPPPHILPDARTRGGSLRAVNLERAGRREPRWHAWAASARMGRGNLRGGEAHAGGGEGHECLGEGGDVGGDDDALDERK